MTFLIANTNTGSLNKDNTELHKRLHNTLTNIINSHPSLDVLTIQETNGYEVNIPPFFNDLPATNHDLLLDHSRGVATYSTTPPTAIIKLPNTKSELLTTTHETTVKGRKNRKKTTKVAIINCYNNFNIDTETLLTDINNHTRHLEYVLGIQQIVIVGDFNEEHIIIPGYAELRHEDWYHKHHHGEQPIPEKSQKTEKSPTKKY